MIEDFATRAWADHHAKFSTGIQTGIRTVMDALNVLHAKQYDAPWRQPAAHSDCPTR